MIDFRRYRDRLIVAVAIAIAFHEILLSFLQSPAPASNDESAAPATRIAIERRPSPTPRPTPRPTPTPRPVEPTPPPHQTPPPRSTPSPSRQIAGRAKGKPAHRHGGGAHKAVPRMATTGHYAAPQAGGVGTAPAPGNGAVPVPGAGGQNGPGTGDQGNGNGAVNADTPCGVVDFIPYAAPKYSNGTASEPIEAKVTFPDGHRETARFPYPWVYPDGEHTDPWSDTNLKDPNFVTTLRLPPPGSDPSTFPPLIQYILKHTDPQGFTYLQPCPTRRG
ncbi:MAG TPA: hypothetical protein VHT05_05215 [Candidatus Elarobacter sp.]|nr:hypothetical protein [Candidatus Elarobacter sp.]